MLLHLELAAQLTVDRVLRLILQNPENGGMHISKDCLTRLRFAKSKQTDANNLEENLLEF